MLKKTLIDKAIWHKAMKITIRLLKVMYNNTRIYQVDSLLLIRPDRYNHLGDY